MKIKDLFKKEKPLFSFEFFPPKTDAGMSNLIKTISSLKELSPSFVSMTYGAGGSTRQRTVELVSKIKNEIGIEAVAHLTCVGHSKKELVEVLSEIHKAGIDNIMALRGDPPQGQKEFVAVKDGFQYATQLVHLIKGQFDFGVGVAGYPEKHLEAASMEADLNHLKEKVEAGADFIVTQLFFDNRDFTKFVAQVRKKGISVPVVAGIMPIKDLDQIKRFTSLCGAKIPTPLLEELERAKGNEEKVIQVGVDHATKQCEELIQMGVAGIHFYTLNKSQSTLEIFRRLKAHHKV